MTLFTHEDEYDSGYDAEPTGYKVVTVHYEEWLALTKRRIVRWWHAHLSRISLEQFEWEQRVEGWQRHMAHADERLAIYAKASGERSMSDTLNLLMHNYEKDLVRNLNRQMWGTPPDDAPLVYKSDIHSVPRRQEAKGNFMGLQVLADKDCPPNKVYVVNPAYLHTEPDAAGWLHPHLDEHEHGGEG